MKKGLFILLLAIAVVACKSDKKEVSETSDKEDELVESTIKTNSFEDKLLDLRDVNLQFNENYKVEKFGIQKMNDSLIGFVFELDKATAAETVKAYSVGIRVFDATLKESINFSFSPDIEEIEGRKYIIGKKHLNNMTYFDSLSVYIYKRKDWKGSGRLGGFKLRDILFEDKK
ncbi:hypothetical protein [Oceanihabitans sediminis]|uniref:hypothetical protein n=1 Tax=Oceanihabitans sediminis TaxID=1812012 RepID=UPI003A8D8CEC